MAAENSALGVSCQRRARYGTAIKNSIYEIFSLKDSKEEFNQRKHIMNFYENKANEGHALNICK